MEHIYVQKDKHPEEAEEATSVEQQTAQLENELAIKERETLDLLKELESTKKIITGLKLKIHKETAETYEAAKSEETGRVSVVETEEQQPEHINVDVDMECKEGNPRQTTSSVSVKLEQAKESLNRTTSDLAAVRAAVELLRNSITKEQMLLERAREKLSANTTLISSLEEELDQTTQKLETLKDLQQRHKDPADIFIEIKKMTSQVQQLRSLANDSKSEAAVLAAEIEQAKVSISIAEVRCIAAKKMEEAARAAEALALGEVKALLSSESPSEGSTASDGMTLSAEEYVALFSKAREADEISRKTEEDVMLQVETANSSESE
jgi:chromosome segregation ATPase